MNDRMRQIIKLSRLWNESCLKYVLTHTPIRYSGKPFIIPFIPKNRFKRVRNQLHRKGII